MWQIILIFAPPYASKTRHPASTQASLSIRHRVERGDQPFTGGSMIPDKGSLVRKWQGGLRSWGAANLAFSSWCSKSQYQEDKCQNTCCQPCVFEQKIPLIGCAGTGPLPLHSYLQLPSSSSSSSSSVCFFPPRRLPLLFLHVNKRQGDETDSIFPSRLCAITEQTHWG